MALADTNGSHGYVIELTAKRDDHDKAFSPDRARTELERWQREKPPVVASPGQEVG